MKVSICIIKCTQTINPPPPRRPPPRWIKWITDSRLLQREGLQNRRKFISIYAKCDDDSIALVSLKTSVVFWTSPFRIPLHHCFEPNRGRVSTILPVNLYKNASPAAWWARSTKRRCRCQVLYPYWRIRSLFCYFFFFFTDESFSVTLPQRFQWIIISETGCNDVVPHCSIPCRPLLTLNLR